MLTSKPIELTLIRPAGRILCSLEHGKLCFEALKTFSVPENNLPLTGKNASEVSVFENIPMIGFQQ